VLSFYPKTQYAGRPSPSAHVTHHACGSGRLKPGSASAQLCSRLLTRRGAVPHHLIRNCPVLAMGPKTCLRVHEMGPRTASQPRRLELRSRKEDCLLGLSSSLAWSAPFYKNGRPPAHLVSALISLTIPPFLFSTLASTSVQSAPCIL
jgi:hypothetical protein